ncbi:hypothetical protein V1512DRAFT_240707 [Lipomyces arxii]|uniref:uncharacterized protein n=1 Tax=Lipomyces arxii TaxID=56418 RepID=UPI0034CFA6A8
MSFLYKSVAVEIAPYLTSTLKFEQICAFQPFVRWFARLQNSLTSTPISGGTNSPAPTYYLLKKIDVTDADFFGKEQTKLGFLKIRATVENEAGQHLPGIVLLRGQSVTILVLIYPEESVTVDGFDDSRAFAVLTVQPRIAGAIMTSVELPAGMLDPTDTRDSSGGLSFTAQRELKEESGIEIGRHELQPLYTTGGGVYMSAGLCDEQLQFFYVRKVMPQAEINELQGKFGGASDEAERITLQVVPFNDLISTATPDAKTLCAVALYHNLKLLSKYEH